MRIACACHRRHPDDPVRPLVVVMITSFNADRAFGWPPSASPSLVVPGRGQRRRTGRVADLVVVGLLSTMIALVLGTLAAMSLQALPVLGRDGRVAAGDPADRAAPAS